MSVLGVPNFKESLEHTIPVPGCDVRQWGRGPTAFPHGMKFRWFSCSKALQDNGGIKDKIGATVVDFKNSLEYKAVTVETVNGFTDSSFLISY